MTKLNLIRKSKRNAREIDIPVDYKFIEPLDLEHKSSIVKAAEFWGLFLEFRSSDGDQKEKSILACDEYLKKYPFDTDAIMFLLWVVDEESMSNRARASAIKRLLKDPKQQEKKFVYERWVEWQANPSQYKNNTKFAHAMIDKFRPDNPDDEDKHLNSVKVITDWCRDWRNENVSELAD